MATRYWVGGAGTWNASSTTNWSTTSGGASGASAPTSSDDVIFDTNSGTGTIAFSGVCVCNNLTVTATQAITFGSGTLYGVYGSLSLPTGGSFSWAGVPVTFRATTTGNTLNWGDKSISQSIIFDGVGGAWTLNSAMSCFVLTVTAGSLNTNGYSVSALQLLSTGTATRSISLGSSVVTLNGGTRALEFSSTGLTFNAGTSTINLTYQSTTPEFWGAGFTFYNVGLTAVGPWGLGINGSNTFNSLSIVQPSTGTRLVTFANNQTIGTLTTSGTTAALRVQFQSSAVGTQRTLSVATIGTLTNTNFKDIALTGAASPWSTPVGVWDLGNNSGITFDTTTLYWIGGTGNWTDPTKWSTSSGGSAANVLPGPTNNVVADTNSGTGNWNAFQTTNQYCKDLTVTASQAITLSGGGTGTISIYGGLSFPSGGSFAVGSTNYNFLSTTTGNNITPNGKLTSGNCTFNGAGGEWTFQGNANVNLTLTQGTLNTNGYNITLGGLNVSGTLTRTLNLGSSTITFGGGSATLTATTQTNLTFNAGTSTIANSANDLSILGSGLTFYNLTFNPSNSNTDRITFNGSHTISGTLTSSSLLANYRRVIMSATFGTQYTLTAAAVSLSDTNFYGIVGAGAASWTGTRLGDGTNNSGITFTAPKTVYWSYAAGGSYVSTNAWATSSGGTPAVNNFPLPQDTVIFDDAGLNTSATVNNTGYPYTFYPNIDFSARTTAMTFQFSGSSAGSGYGCGNLTLDSNVTYGTTSALIMLGSTTITSNGASLNTLPLTVAVGATLTNADTLTSSSSLTNSGTLTLGANATFTTLTLNGTTNLSTYTLTGTTCSVGASSTTNFGTGKISLTGNAATIFNQIASSTQSVTGNPIVEATYSGATGTRTIQGNPFSEAAAFSFNITAGTDIVAVSTSKDINFTGFAGTLNNSVRTLYGNLTVSSGMTLSAGTNVTTFAATSGTKTITTNGKTLDFPITFNGVGGTWQLADNLTQGSTREVILTNGTVDLNAKTFTIGQFTTTAGTKNLTFNGGVLLVTASGVNAFANNAPTGFTTTAGTGTGKISLNSATAKSFKGGGATYNCTLENAGAGALTITGSNTFTTISNSVQPTSFLFTAGTTTTVTNFNVSGTSGNLVTIGSDTTASHTLSKSSGIVNVSYCTISRSTATGGARWQAYTTNGNVDGGNNSGWRFSAFSGNGLFFGSNF